MAGEELDDCHLIQLSYMADGPDDMPIAVRAACKLCHKAWEFVGTTEDVKDYERQLTAANDRAERYKADAERLAAAFEAHLRVEADSYDMDEERWPELLDEQASEAFDAHHALLNPIPNSDTGENDQGA